MDKNKSIGQKIKILAFKTGHDPAACLLEDGKIIAAVEEERFVRVKHAADFFPYGVGSRCIRPPHFSAESGGRPIGI